MIEARNVIGDKASGAQTHIENLHLYLTAVGVAREAQLDAKFRCAIESIRIMGQQKVRHVTPDQRFDIGEHLQPAATRHALALVIDTDEVELAAAV